MHALLVLVDDDVPRVALGFARRRRQRNDGVLTRFKTKHEVVHLGRDRHLVGRVRVIGVDDNDFVYTRKTSSLQRLSSAVSQFKLLYKYLIAESTTWAPAEPHLPPSPGI